MENLKCSTCGYTYETEVGDEEQGVPSGTEWNDLPKSWCCPVCNGGKREFYIQKICKKCA